MFYVTALAPALLVYKSPGQQAAVETFKISHKNHYRCKRVLYVIFLQRLLTAVYKTHKFHKVIMGGLPGIIPLDIHNRRNSNIKNTF
ncbi:hypothetical protein SG34_030985 [Thalassomonas viridans]|uniref:Uncharacterized protein n=1 Tax=Thalassomonas viridans TaxID=137584 RepID=A0AAF0CB04_9GAMM|nr:hypothetical protein [Thalassomonas viridans]WDE09192.1 hypothetical protein SG34_030985 [Thalassomonas viridans]